jgi:hypothetical protein
MVPESGFIMKAFSDKILNETELSPQNWPSRI